MGIRALQNTTVRALGASQVLNDPASVIKELLDNALDARATSIAIEISHNTVDSIQVRDNGHGIPPEDRPLVARPHCTSKIGCEDDLKDIGGTSLGFRGEALASVAEMSSSVTISTRVEGEEVAAALSMNQQGEIVGQERVSLPVGTTVKITGFVKAYPVRNQNALKNSEKCLKRIKLTLQSYAFARPHVRLSLRVLKAKNDKANWTYAPKAGGNAEDAAFKIVGAACASQCIWSVVEDGGFTLQAFLPKLDADASKVSNTGPFLSIDGRPVSAARGTPKQIAKIFREALKKAYANPDGIKDPFIYMEIACPVSSYDANVEPAKDDVLFENPDIVVEAARRLFDKAYPSTQLAQLPKEQVGPTPTQSSDRPQFPDPDDFITSLEFPYSEHPNSKASPKYARSLIPGDVLKDLVNNWDDGVSNDEEPTKRPRFRSTMYECDEEDLDLIDARPPTGRTDADFEELRQARKDVNLSNPWVMAKMHATSRRQAPKTDEMNTRHSVHDLADHSLGSESRRNPFSTELDSPNLPTPRPSSPSPSLSSLPFCSSQHMPNLGSGDGRGIGPQSLPPPLMVLAPASSFHGDTENVAPEMESRREAYDYTLSSQAAELPGGTPLHAIPAGTQKSRRMPGKKLQQTQLNKPFVSPLKQQPPKEKVWFDHLQNRGGERKRRYQDISSVGLVSQGELGDLVDDPHVLTPPRRNRDMRDFVTHLDLTESDSAASVIESRNSRVRKRGPSARGPLQRPNNHHVEGSALANTLSGSGFETSDKLVAIEAHRPNESGSRKAKRRKTSEGRAMREISANAGPRRSDNNDDEFRPWASCRASHRRRTTDGNKSRRTKSSQLPLERVPTGQGTHRIVLRSTTTTPEVIYSVDRIDQGRSLLGWSQTPEETASTFAVICDATEVKALTAKLYELLVNRVSDGEMVQDLGVLVQKAFSAHERVVMTVEAEAAQGLKGYLAV